MLMQTNSYVVPKERRAEHHRLMRRFRQTLARLGCEHFEVYEQVGSNWAAGDNAGRYVQIMRFRDRRHQMAVQSAERADPGAQAVIADFCNLINFPYQQQQNIFAVGYYQSALPVTVRREATRAEVEASDGAAAAKASEGVGDAELETPVEPDVQAGSELDEAAVPQEDLAGEKDEAQVTKQEQGIASEDADGEYEELLPSGVGQPGLAQEAHRADQTHEEEVRATALGPDDAKIAEAGEKHETAEQSAGIEAHEEARAAGVSATEAVEENFGDESFDALIPQEPALPAHAQDALEELPAESEFGALQQDGANAHEQEVGAGVVAGELEASAVAEPTLAVGNEALAPVGVGGGWESEEAVEAVELSAEEGDIEIVYEQLPATADEAAEPETEDQGADEESGFDALLSSEQLVEGLDSDDGPDHGAAHLAELHAHGVAGSQNGKSTANGDAPYAQSAGTATRHGRIR